VTHHFISVLPMDRLLMAIFVVSDHRPCTAAPPDAGINGQSAASVFARLIMGPLVLSNAPFFHLHLY
jgi:hypothetical protein